MGWCSATDIMDVAVSAAEEAVVAAVRAIVGPEATPLTSARTEVDAALRPYVARIAEQLRDGGWDCIEEAADFDRFRQEMLGFDHTRMVEWYREKIKYADDPDEVRELAEAMAKHLEATT